MLRAVLGMAVILFSSPGLSGEPEPSRPEPTSTWRSLAALRRSHDLALFNDLVSYLDAVEDAPDQEEAYQALFDLAIRHGWYARAEPMARNYLESPPLGRSAPLAHLVAAMADAEAGQVRAAVVLYRDLMAGLDPNEHARLAVDLADSMADAALASGLAEPAREVYVCLLDRFGSVPGIATKVLAEQDRIAMLGKPAPSISCQDIQGKPLALDDYQSEGRHTLVVFWTTWSEPCRAELAGLKEAFETYRDQGLAIVSIGLDETRETLIAEDLPWRQVHNATCGANWAEPFHVNSVPSTFLIGPDGTIVRLGLRGRSLDRALAEVLGTDDPE